MKTGIVVSWLRNRGYPSVMGLSGGYAGWRALRYPVVSMEVSGPLVTA